MRQVVCFLAFFWLIERKKKKKIGNVNPKCATCAFAMNEVEGFLIENRTEVEIVAYLESLCPLFHGAMQFVCASIVKQAPALLVNIENKWQVARQAKCHKEGVLLIARLSESASTSRFVWCLCVASLTLRGQMCEAPVTTQPDFQSVPTYQVNYDLAPRQRWSQLCALPHAKLKPSNEETSCSHNLSRFYLNHFISTVSAVGEFVMFFFFCC